MIIDSHVHLGTNENISASVGQLLLSMDSAGIDKALVFAGRVGGCSNKYLMEQIKPYKDRLYGVASISIGRYWSAYRGFPSEINSDKDMSKNDMLDTLDVGAVGIKLYTGYEHYSPNSDAVKSILELIKDKNKPVIFHAGDCLNACEKAKLRYCQPIDVDDVAVDYPNNKFIISHLGNPWIKDTAQVCYKNKNVYADISGFVYGSFSLKDQILFKKSLNKFLEICPSDKLLFGTDWPISDQSSYINVLNSSFGEVLSAQYLSGNVMKVFNLK